MSLSNPLWHWSASSWELDRSCQRARFLHSCQGGTGIEPAHYDTKSLPLEFGSGYHKALASVRLGVAPEDAVDEAVTLHLSPLLPTLDELTAKEVEWNLRGMFWGWHRVRWPHEQVLYDMSQARVEQKLVSQETGLVAVMDLLVPLRSNGRWVYQDEKTTGVTPDAAWMEEWTRKVQLAAGPLVASHALGLDVAYSVIVGHYKGYWAKQEDGSRRWVTPFTQGWAQGVGFDGLPIDWAPKRPKTWKGWEFRYAWDVWPDVRTLVSRLHVDHLTKLYAQSDPIQVSPLQRDAWLRQGLKREEVLIQLAEMEKAGRADEVVLDLTAQQNWNACKSDRFGTCRFFKVCWLPEVGADPVGSGFYRPRKDEWAELMKGEVEE